MQQLRIQPRILVAVSGAAFLLGSVGPGAAVAETSELFSGVLEVVHADGEDATSQTFYWLHSGGKRFGFYRLGALGKPIQAGNLELVSGIAAQLRGVRVGNDILLAASGDGSDLVFPSPPVAPSALVSPQLLAASGPPQAHPTLVILGDFTDVSLTCTPTDVDHLMFTDLDSAAANFAESSFDQVDFDGEVIGPFSIPYASTGASYLSWGTALDSAAQNAGYTLTDYLHIVYVLPANASGFTGLGTTGIGPDGYGSAWVFRCDRPGVYAHETGHNFTMGHASRYFIDTNSVWTYGDQTCPMGSQVDVRHFNAPHKYKAGWISEDNVTTVTNDGVYLLHRAEDEQVDGAHLLRIANPEPHIGSTDTYWVSYRTATGLDANLATTYQNKVFVHEANASPATTYLRNWLDTGESFEEPPGSSSPVSVRVVAQNGLVASVLVTGVGPPLSVAAMPPSLLGVTALFLIAVARRGIAARG